MDMDRCIEPEGGETDNYCIRMMDWNPDMACYMHPDRDADVCNAESWQ